MLDIKFIRENIDEVKKNNLRRAGRADVDLILGLDEERRKLISKLEPLRHLLKKKDRPQEEEIEKLRQIGEQIRGIEEELKSAEESLEREASLLPNMLSENVPDGESDKDNVEIKRAGDIPKFNFEPLDHQAIGERLNIIDTERASKVAQSGFYFLKNDGVKLRLALINFAFSVLESEGFELFFTPHLAKTRTLFGTGYLPFFEDQIYRVGESDLSLIGTSEQMIVAYHADEILNEDNLPKLYAGYSSCFRTEAGSYGKDTRGIFRVHEFAKTEQIVFCKPKESDKWLNKTIEIEEKLCSELRVPYRVMRICVGDLGAPGYEKYDLEAWFPSQQRYREVTSATNLTDFQTRRLNIRYKEKDGNAGYLHTISSTGLTDRHLIAILENYQCSDGSVIIPERLRPYFNGRSRIEPR